MSVTGFMYNVNAAKKLQDLELKEGYEGSRSWHHKYKDSAYIYIGGLHLGLTEGDAVIMFSQFGEIIDVNLIRDKTTGKSKGFCFICYEDQRSTILAVDNMNGASVLGRTLRVDHVEKYKAPKKLDEENLDENGDATLLEYKATGAEGKGLGVYNEIASQKRISEVDSERRKRATENQKNGKEDEDEKWAKQFEASLAEKAERKALKKERDELKRVKKETKKLKKLAKQVKKGKKKGKKEKKDDKGKKVKKEAKSSSESASSDSDSGS